VLHVYSLPPASADQPDLAAIFRNLFYFNKKNQEPQVIFWNLSVVKSRNTATQHIVMLLSSVIWRNINAGWNFLSETRRQQQRTVKLAIECEESLYKSEIMVSYPPGIN
jgi:hypothetical protein